MKICADQATATLLPGTDNAAAPFFAPDGQWIGFFADGKMKKISVPAFSPDGRWIAYSSNESGRYDVYVRPFPGGASSGSAKWQISTGGGRYPIWSRGAL